MSEEKAPETAKDTAAKESKKPAAKKPTAKKPTKRMLVIKRKRNLAILRDANARFDNDASDEEIAELSAAIPPEKYYKLLLQEKEDVEAKAYIGVNGRPWFIERGEEVVVPARVIEALKNATGFVPFLSRNKLTGERETKEKKIHAELYSFYEVPNPNLSNDVK